MNNPSGINGVVSEPKQSFTPKYILIRDFLLAEFARGSIPTAQEVAHTFGVSRQYVHDHRSKLIREGKLPVSPRGRGGAPNEERLQRKAARLQRKEDLKVAAAKRSAQAAALRALKSERPTEAILDALEVGAKPMTTEEKRSFLSELAKRTHREEIKVQALSALNRLDSTLRVEDALGPRDPLSREEAAARLSKLQEALSELYPAQS